jgi:hypothetical protein
MLREYRGAVTGGDRAPGTADDEKDRADSGADGARRIW